MLADEIVFLLVQGEDDVHSAIKKSGVSFVTYPEAGGVTVPETAVEFVEGVGGGVEVIDSAAKVNELSNFTAVVGVSDVNEVVEEMAGPFVGDGGLVDASSASPQQQFTGDGVGSRAVRG